MALMAASTALQAQDKGGGKPGGGGGEEPPPGGDPEYLYTTTRIEPPAGTKRIFPLGMNNHAHVVGGSYFQSGKNDEPGPAFHWADGVYTALPALQPDAPTQAWAVADNGHIVARGKDGNSSVFVVLTPVP